MTPRKRKLATQAGQLVLVVAGVVLCVSFATGFGGSASRSGSSPSQGSQGASQSQAQPSPDLSFDAKILLKQFQAAQQNEMNGLLTRERKVAKALRAAQTAEQKDFDRREKDARRKFFAADHPGAEKRAYMKDLLARRDALHKQMAADRAQAKQESDDRVQALRDEQQLKLKKFQDELRQNQRPDDSLWPQPTLETD